MLFLFPTCASGTLCSALLITPSPSWCNPRGDAHGSARVGGTVLVFAPLSGHAALPMAEEVLAVAFLPPFTVTMQVARQLAPAASPH